MLFRGNIHVKSLEVVGERQAIGLVQLVGHHAYVARRRVEGVDLVRQPGLGLEVLQVGVPGPRPLARGRRSMLLTYAGSVKKMIPEECTFASFNALNSRP